MPSLHRRKMPEKQNPGIRNGYVMIVFADKDLLLIEKDGTYRFPSIADCGLPLCRKCFISMERKPTVFYLRWSRFLQTCENASPRVIPTSAISRLFESHQSRRTYQFRPRQPLLPEMRHAPPPRLRDKQAMPIVRQRNLPSALTRNSCACSRGESPSCACPQLLASDVRACRRIRRDGRIA